MNNVCCTTHANKVVSPGAHGEFRKWFLLFARLFYKAEMCCPKYWLYELTARQWEGSGGCWNFTWGCNSGWHQCWWPRALLHTRGRPCSPVLRSCTCQMLKPRDPKPRGCLDGVLPFVKTSFSQTESQQKHFHVICKYKWKQWFESRDVFSLQHPALTQHGKEGPKARLTSRISIIQADRGAKRKGKT